MHTDVYAYCSLVTTHRIQKLLLRNSSVVYLLEVHMYMYTYMYVFICLKRCAL